MNLFWDREGNPIDFVLDWAMQFENPEIRIVSVDQDSEGSPMVSTIWEGLDLAHNMHPDAIPMIFETAYLVATETGAGHLQERWLSATEAEALTTHRMVCLDKLGREPLPEGGLKGEIIRLERESRG